jgi:hypothetical protein
MAYIGKQPVVGNFVKLDAITTSATATYNLLNGGVAYFPQTANNCIVSLNGVIQSPTSAYTISGSTIVFSDALTASDSIDFILVLGDVLAIGTPSDATVTNAKLALTAGSAGTPTISTAADTNTGIFFPAADTIGFAEGGAEAMRITSAGRVAIGITNPTKELEVRGASATLRLSESTSGGDKRMEIGVTSAGQAFIAANQSAQSISFETTGTERMNISSTGQISTTATAGGNVAFINLQSSLDPYGIFFQFTGASPDNNTNYLLRFVDGSSTTRLYIYSDGDVQNHDNSYGSISDERIKQDIRDSNSQWNDIKNIKVRNFKKKDDVRQYGENAWEQIGLVAQELEIVSPKLIKHSDPSPSDILSDSSFGTLYEEGDEIPEGKKIGDVKEVYEQVKSVSYSVLYMKAIKALQEAMERIEQLETKTTSLEARLTALESNIS